MKNETKVKKTKSVKSNKEVEQLRSEKEILNDKYLRLGAEMQNMMKRQEEEKSRMLKYDGEEFIVKILQVVDDFERAIALATQSNNDEVTKFLEGFKLIYANLLKSLESQEVKEIVCLGKEFDPVTMNAVLTEAIVEEEPNIVLDVLQKGYMYKDKVIRIAMVKVNE